LAAEPWALEIRLDQFQNGSSQSLRADQLVAVLTIGIIGFCWTV